MLSNKFLAKVGVGLLATTTLVFIPASAANAASACWDNGYVGEAWTYWCSVSVGAPVVDSIYGGPIVDHLRSNPSWFECWTDQGIFNGETRGPHPWRWVSTVGDDNGHGGWVSDAYIQSETNSIPNCGM
jgi:hypothetical protein